MTVIDVPRRWTTFLFLVLCTLLLTAVLLAPAVFARPTTVIQDDDSAWSGEGKPHDWDSPQERNSYAPPANGVEQIVRIEGKPTDSWSPPISRVTTRTGISYWLLLLAFSFVRWG